MIHCLNFKIASLIYLLHEQIVTIILHHNGMHCYIDKMKINTQKKNE